MNNDVYQSQHSVQYVVLLYHFDSNMRFVYRHLESRDMRHRVSSPLNAAAFSVALVPGTTYGSFVADYHSYVISFPRIVFEVLRWRPRVTIPRVRVTSNTQLFRTNKRYKYLYKYYHRYLFVFCLHPTWYYHHRACLARPLQSLGPSTDR